MLAKRFVVNILFICLIGVSNANQPAETCLNFPKLRPNTGVFMHLNCDFHNLYAYKIKMIKSTLGAPHGIPVILNLGGRLILKYNGQTRNIDITPDPYSQLKSFSHGLFSIFLILSALNSNGDVYKNNREGLLLILRELESSKIYLNKVAPSIAKDVNFTIRETRSFVYIVLSNKHWSMDDLKKYYSKIYSPLKNIIKYTASIEISALDKALNDWIVNIPKADLANLGIVVAVSHQARAREITVTYFTKKFHKIICAGALCEDGLIVMEDKFDENSAYELLARHFLDRQAGEVIFNDPRRMQSDIMAM